MNGGEDFLIYDFGSSLDDDQFEVLSNVLMDYHYINKEDISRELGKDLSFVSATETAIIKKLDKYYERKEEIDRLIERAGGAKLVKEQIFDKLKDIDKVIFLEYTLAYIKPTRDEIAEKIGRGVDYVAYTSKAIINRLESMAEENEKD